MRCAFCRLGNDFQQLQVARADSPEKRYNSPHKTGFRIAFQHHLISIAEVNQDLGSLAGGEDHAVGLKGRLEESAICGDLMKLAVVVKADVVDSRIRAV